MRHLLACCLLSLNFESNLSFHFIQAWKRTNISISLVLSRKLLLIFFLIAYALNPLFTFCCFLVQSKQKRSGRKGKDRAKDEKFGVIGQDTNQRESPSGKRTIGDISMKQGRSVLEKPIALEDISDASDTDDDVAETLQCDLEDRDGSLVSWDTETSAIHTSIEVSGSTSSLPVQNGVIEKKSPSIMDDSSSTCSTDSVPSVVMNGPYKGNSFPNNKCQTSPSR